jgi:hypothetical protein
MKMPGTLSDCITKAQEKQKHVLSEPDPEEKDDHEATMQLREEKIYTDCLYNTSIAMQQEIESNG